MSWYSYLYSGGCIQGAVLITMPTQGNCLIDFVHNGYKSVIVNKNKTTRPRIYKRKTLILFDYSTLCFKKNILKVCIRFLYPVLLLETDCGGYEPTYQTQDGESRFKDRSEG